MPLDVIPMCFSNALDIGNTYIENDWSSGCCSWWSEIPSVARPAKFGRLCQETCPEESDIKRSSGTNINVQSNSLKLPH